MPRLRHRVASTVIALSAGCTGSARERPAPVVVAAAADLTHAFGALGPAFEVETGRQLVFTFGASGMLARQIRAGAPFDVFAAANTAFVDELVQAGVCDGATQARYARGRIGIWVKHGLVKPPAGLAELADTRFRRIAIANPDHAPYGLAAKQTLERIGLWHTLEPRIVYGENVAQTLQFARSGNVEAAIVALSLAADDTTGDSLPIDEALHAPIAQALVVCNSGKNAAGGRAFARFVLGERGRALLRRHGLLVPDAGLP